MYTLVPFQNDAVKGLRQLYVEDRCRRVILQSPTGSGKSVTASEVARLAYERGQRVLVLAHRRELVRQLHNHFLRHHIPHGVIMVGYIQDPGQPVQIASKDTVLSWCERRGELALPPAHFVIVDECHLFTTRRAQDLLERYRHARILGLTATPVGKNGRGLGYYWDGMYCCPGPSALIRMNRIVPTICYAPFRPDLKGCRTDQDGDWIPGDLSKRMNNAVLTGDAVQRWKELANDRLTIVFCTNIDHSLAVTRAYKTAGIPAAHIDGKMKTAERDPILGSLWHGDIKVLCNVGILPEGVDVPPAACVQLLRPTRSYRLYLQMIGRVRRPWDEVIAEESGRPFEYYPAGWKKENALVLDHAGATFLHGLPDRDVEWTLNEDSKIEDVLRGTRLPSEPASLTCPRCFTVFEKLRQCPRCGFLLERQGKSKPVRHGKLGRVRDEHVAYLRSPDARRRYWHRCLAIAAHKGWRASMAGAMYKAHFGNWPETGLPNLPSSDYDWSRDVGEMFPQYLRLKGH